MPFINGYTWKEYLIWFLSIGVGIMGAVDVLMVRTGIGYTAIGLGIGVTFVVMLDRARRKTMVFGDKN